MIKHILFIGLLISTVFAVAQKKKQPKPFSFTVAGTISKFNGSMIYLHHKWDEVDYTDSAAVVNGAFTFNLKSIDPNMYWFTLTRKVTEMPNVIFFADKTPTNAKLIGDSLLYSTVTGGQTQKDYMDYKGVMNNLTLSQQQLQSEYTLAMQKNDQATVKVIQGKYQTITADYYSVELKNFVKSHPKSAVSGYIIYREFNNPNVPIDLAFECLSYVDKSIEDTKFIKLASKRINDIKGTMIGAKATNFSQSTADGKMVQLKDYKGKYVLIDFWASWCRPCRMENPTVVAAYNQYKDKGFDVLGVSLDNNKELWTAAIKNDKLTWANVSDLKGGNNEVAVLFGIQNIPQNVLIDREGKIVAKNLRGPALEEKLAELMK